MHYTTIRIVRREDRRCTGIVELRGPHWWHWCQRGPTIFALPRPCDGKGWMGDLSPVLAGVDPKHVNNGGLTFAHIYARYRDATVSILRCRNEIGVSISAIDEEGKHLLPYITWRSTHHSLQTFWSSFSPIRAWLCRHRIFLAKRHNNTPKKEYIAMGLLVQVRKTGRRIGFKSFHRRRSKP